jgi:hypothetical protein
MPPALRLAVIVGCLWSWGAASPVARAAETETDADRWRTLEPGLDFGVFAAPIAATSGDSKIRILRIDPARFELRLLMASASTDGEPLTARAWCVRRGLVAAVNASMYQADFRRSVSLMRTRTHVNNARLSKDNTVLAFDPLDESDAALPPVQIIDRTCQDLDSLRTHYGTLVQSIRMISCRGNNVWSPQEKRWSAAAIGTDRQGRVLFIHVASPYSTHDLIECLLALPIDIANTMYAEGGPEAQLYIAAGGETHELLGSLATGISGNDDIHMAWPVPNVIGVVRRER